MNRITQIILLFIFLTAFFVRLYKFNNPVADWHSWRQADTSAVTRNFIQEGYSPFFPKFDTLNSLNDGQIPNPNRYFMAEFPLYNSLAFFGYKIFGIFEIEQWGRIVSILSSSATVLVLFFLVREFSSRKVAVLSSFFFAILPFNVYYGRTILPDPLHVFLSVLTLYFVALWTRTSKWQFALFGGIAFSGALLTKPYALVLFFPILYLLTRKWGIQFLREKGIYLFFTLSLIPFFLWRNHISNYPEGMFGTSWLFNQGNIRFTGAYFRWLVFERMNKLIFATGGFVLFWFGIVKGYDKKEGLFYYSWLAAVLGFFVVIAKGNVTHDYYQLPLVPIGCIFIAKGVEFLVSSDGGFTRKITNLSIAIVLIGFMVAFGWYEARDLFNINNPAIVNAGQVVDKTLPADAKVIAPYLNDPAFLYQTNRHGWTLGGDKIEQFISEGATHLVSVNFDDETNFWIKKCAVLVRNSEFVVIDLKNCADNPQ